MLNSRAILLLTVAIAFFGIFTSSVLPSLSRITHIVRIAGIFSLSPKQPGPASPEHPPAPAQTQTTSNNMPPLVYRAPLIIPAIGRHTATVIFTHGLGDTGHGWSDVVKMFQQRGRLNEVKFILPHAPSIAVTLNGGTSMPAWFDFRGTDLMNLEEEGEDEAGMLESRRYLQSLIDNEIERNGIPSGRIVLGGFSQGGSMSLFTGLTSSARLAGIVGLSCWLVMHRKFKSFLPAEGFNKETPIFMGHGDDDPFILHEWGQAAHKALLENGFPATFKTYPGVGHTAFIQEIRDVEEFLASRLPAKDT